MLSENDNNRRLFFDLSWWRKGVFNEIDEVEEVFLVFPIPKFKSTVKSLQFDYFKKRERQQEEAQTLKFHISHN